MFSEGDVLFEKEESVINVVDSDDNVNVLDNNYTHEYQGWDAIEQFSHLRINKKISNVPGSEKVKTALDELTHQRLIKKKSQSLRLYELLESAGKLFGNGPKWSNPDHSQFNRMNEERIEVGDLPLVYIKKPKYASQENEMYYYKLQFPSEQQKLQAKNRYQEAVKFGLILPDNSETINYTVNQSPWEMDKYKSSWDELSKELKSEPWKSQPSILKSYIKLKHKEISINIATSKSNVVKDQVIITSQSTQSNGRNLGKKVQNHIQCTFNLQPKVPVNAVNGEMRLIELFNNSQSRNDTALKGNMGIEGDSFNFKSKKKVLEELDYLNSNDSGEIHNDDVKYSKDYVPDEDEHLSDDRVQVVNHLTYNNGSSCRNEIDSDDHDDIFRRPSKMSLNFSNNSNESNNDRENNNDTVEDDGYGGYSNDDVNNDSDYEKEVDHKEEDGYEIAKIDLYEPLSNNSIRDDRKLINRIERNEENNIIDVKNQKHSQKLMTKTEKRKRLEFLNKMFDYEAEESEDENLSDPEDRKKIKLLRKNRLEASSDSEGFSSDDNFEELADFLTTADNLNPDDEDLARQRFYADMNEEDEERLKRLMIIREKINKGLIKRKYAIKKVRNGLENDYHLSDFESSEEDSGYEYESDELIDDDGEVYGGNADAANKCMGRRDSKRENTILFANDLSEERLELMDFLEFKLNTRQESVDTTNKDIDEAIDCIVSRGNADNKSVRKLKLDKILLKPSNLLCETDRGDLRNVLKQKAIDNFQKMLKKNINNLNKFKCKAAKSTH